MTTHHFAIFYSLEERRYSKKRTYTGCEQQEAGHFTGWLPQAEIKPPEVKRMVSELHNGINRLDTAVEELVNLKI